MKTYRIIDLGKSTYENYAATRRALLRKADELTVAISKLEPVRDLEQMNTLLALEEERRLIVSMIASCSYVMDWLASGSMPGNRRSMERRAGYQREVLTDPFRMPRQADSYTEHRRSGDDGCTSADRDRLERVLQMLTERERDCYVLAYGERFTYSEIANLLQISKSSVGTYMARAQRKIALATGSLKSRVG